QRWRDAQDVGHCGVERDQAEVLQVVVRQLGVQAGGNRLVDAVGEDRVPVGGRARRDLGADDAARAGAVVDDQRLPPDLAEALREEAPDDVGGAAGAERQDEPPGLVGIGLRRARERRRCGYRQCRRDSTDRTDAQFHDAPRIWVLKDSISTASGPRVTDHELRVTSHELRVTSYESRLRSIFLVTGLTYPPHS